MDDWYLVINNCKEGREGKKGERISRKIGKNQTRERGKTIKRRGKKAKRIAEKRVGSREKEVVGRVARTKWDQLAGLNNIINRIELSRPKPILRANWVMWIFD